MEVKISEREDERNGNLVGLLVSAVLAVLVRNDRTHTSSVIFNKEGVTYTIKLDD